MTKRRYLRRFHLASRIHRLYLYPYLPKQMGNVLDLCAGDGEMSADISPHAAMVYAVDNDPVRINRIHNLVQERKIKNIRICCCSATTLPFQNNYFDIVVCNSALEHIQEYEEVLIEIHRVIKKDGLLLLTVPNSDYQFGNKLEWFWKIVFAAPLSLREFICRNKEIAKLTSISSVRNYNNEYFKHIVSFTPEKLRKDLSGLFDIIEMRQYMNFFGAYGHDSAYYFKTSSFKPALYLRLAVCWLERLFFRHAQGKGIMAICTPKQ